MIELPLIVIDVQRAGPSTGLPTKVEQSDLLFAMYGRHGEAPLPILAISTPGDAFEVGIEAARIAVKYMTPVIVLSDGYVANSSEPWRLADLDLIPDIQVPYATVPNDGDVFLPYKRNPQTLARPWAIPGTPGLEHRIGGLEKEVDTGNVSYDPHNHEEMTKLREYKVRDIADDIPLLEIDGDEDAGLLVLGWGSTFGAIRAGTRNSARNGRRVAHAHLRHINPFPSNLGDVLARFDKVLIPELNRGQLSRLIRARYLIDTVTLSKVQGAPFKAHEIEVKIDEMLGEEVRR
jgi:2-oxoglutarate ferredoxin oxidoreductase subunit alpha